MAIFAFNLFNLFSVMALGAILLKCLPMIVSGGVAVRAFQSIARHMGLMRKFDIVEGNRPFLDAHMTKGHTGHSGLKLFRFIGLVQDSSGLFRLTIGRVEEFEGILNIMNTLPQKDKTIIVPRLVEKILSLFKVPCPLPVPFELI
jgi:hypothetical protein